MGSWITSNPLLTAAIGCAGISAVLMLWFLIARPATMTHATKLILLFGIGILPMTTAATGGIAGFEATKARRFCGSCHVMTPYKEDSENPKSTSLAARHARNALFGEENCYACHADYGMFGTIVTKAGGMRHVYEYLLNYRNMSLEEARKSIHIRKPFQNATCMHCHSTQGPIWNAVKEHASLLDRLRSGTLSCASVGCHGPSHPFSKSPEQLVPDPVAKAVQPDLQLDAGTAPQTTAVDAAAAPATPAAPAAPATEPKP
jgi:cytochrome c-type protein NapC